MSWASLAAQFPQQVNHPQKPRQQLWSCRQDSLVVSSSLKRDRHEGMTTMQVRQATPADMTTLALALSSRGQPLSARSPQKAASPLLQG